MPSRENTRLETFGQRLLNPDATTDWVLGTSAASTVVCVSGFKYLQIRWVRAVPEIILREGGPQTLFCPVGGGCFVDSVSEG